MGARLSCKRAGIHVQAEFGFKADPNMKDQMKYAFDSGIRYLVVFGEEEINAGAFCL